MLVAVSSGYLQSLESFSGGGHYYFGGCFANGLESHRRLAVHPRAMRLMIEIDDDESAAFLMEMAEASHCEPRAIASALLIDVLRDDARAHGQVHAGLDRGILQ